ncbi:CANX [Cordylochernes scorpioides]|uniref:CANX n=1 Tax=Cordylochernes scorpioides TaxID=51811 RepID=A0ABY6K1S8_9ARAC|nr:CANX [Cordylochernes scorpioides]
MEQQLPARMSLDVTGVFFSTRHQLSAWKSGVIKCLGFWAKRWSISLCGREAMYPFDVHHTYTFCWVLLAKYQAFGEDVDDSFVDIETEPQIVEEVPADKIVYSSPQPLGNYYLAEHFDDRDGFSKRWILSQAKKENADDNISNLAGDLGLVLKSKAHHHAISTPLEKPFLFDNKPFILQYEVQFQNGQECGGAYIKLLSQSSDLDLHTFTDATPYTIMFGPDKCGVDSKLHFIFRHRNPKSGKQEEKHWKRATTVPKLEDIFKDKKPHLLTLILMPDNTFEVLLDKRSVHKGSLLEEFSPPVNPPSEIDDPTDKKPDDWDERDKIPDPSAQKPTDWDETAPRQIPDPNSKKPDDWLDNEPELIPDPNAEKPKDWDDDMDGEWEAPLISNPKCENVGCGEWKPAMINNPAYKGKWKAPMIDNPKYMGKWKARKIPNPDFFEDLHPYKMIPIAAIGFELWSMSENILFDNLIITDDPYVADHWAQETWALKKELADWETDSWLLQLIKYTNKHPWLWAVYILLIALPVVLFISFCCTTRETEEDRRARHKKTDEELPPNVMPPQSPETSHHLASTAEEEEAEVQEEESEGNEVEEENAEVPEKKEPEPKASPKKKPQVNEKGSGDGNPPGSPKKPLGSPKKPLRKE